METGETVDTTMFVSPVRVLSPRAVLLANESVRCTYSPAISYSIGCGRGHRSRVQSGFQGVDDTTGVRMFARRTVRTRDQIYQPGLPATPGQHYRAFVRFAAEHAGETILDLGCGYGAYSLAL